MAKVLIYGGGIAGCVLAMKLHAQNVEVHLADFPFQNAASRVAAGIFNPITGKRFSLSWAVADSWQAIYDFYPSLEQTLNARFFHPMPLLRFLHDQSQQNDWMARSSDERFTPFLADPPIQEHAYFQAHDFGFLAVNQAGWLNTTVFIEAVHHFFQERGRFFPQQLHPEQIHFASGKIGWNENTYDAVVQCSGVRPFQDPFWRWLPFTPMRGEVLDIHSENFPSDAIFVKQHFIVPLSENTFRIGSTYDWRITDEVVTEEGKKRLMDFASEMTGGDFKMLNIRAGVRPAVKDRRPLVGRHPEHPNLYLFNGFGSKAVSLAPWLADQLIAYIEQDVALPAQADLLRFLH